MLKLRVVKLKTEELKTLQYYVDKQGLSWVVSYYNKGILCDKITSTLACVKDIITQASKKREEDKYLGTYFLLELVLKDRKSIVIYQNGIGVNDGYIYASMLQIGVLKPVRCFYNHENLQFVGYFSRQDGNTYIRLKEDLLDVTVTLDVFFNKNLGCIVSSTDAKRLNYIPNMTKAQLKDFQQYLIYTFINDASVYFGAKPFHYDLSLNTSLEDFKMRMPSNTRRSKLINILIKEGIDTIGKLVSVIDTGLEVYQDIEEKVLADLRVHLIHFGFLRYNGQNLYYIDTRSERKY